MVDEVTDDGRAPGDPVRLDGGVLVGHDGSAPAREALRWAAGRCLREGLTLHVLRAWEAPAAGGAAGEPAPRQETVELELAVDVLDAALDPRLTVVRHVVRGPAAPVLVEAARGATMLVLGPRGRDGFPGLLLGSVSDQCVRHAPCPVTVVRSPASRSAAVRSVGLRDRSGRDVNRDGGRDGGRVSGGV